MCLRISQNHHFQITRLEGELIKNEEEILSLKQSLVDKKDTITSKESEIVQIKSEMNHQGEQHKAFVQVTVCLQNFIKVDFLFF